jgi:hypothetical protein
VTVDAITLWACDTCDYWREDRATGFDGERRHMTTNPADPNGPLIAHELFPVRFVRADPEDTQAGRGKVL